MGEPEPGNALLVDLYELTMAAGYFEHRIEWRSTFELFVRHLPPERSYLVAAGLDSVLVYLENLHFTEEDIQFLREQPAFHTVSPAFFDYLRGFRFKGDVHAMEEGTLVFADEPILQITGPILEAQVVETYLLSVINFETLVASKAARVVSAAQGRGVLEFGTRRAHGPEAGVRAARAAYVGGCIATSNVLAGRGYGIPLAGTAAHSWTQAFPTERRSFEALLETFPDSAILLIDTYNPLVGAETAATLGRKIPGVRLDSGDLLEKSERVREILDQRGMKDTQIVASGDLNEFKIEELVAKGAPIDSFGVGTDLATSRDVPALSVVYKVVEIERDGRIEFKTKFSEDKVYFPGRKQIFRFSEAGEFHHDLIARVDETYRDATPLLRLVMRDGRRLAPAASVTEMRAHTLSNLERLPKIYQALHDAPRYPVEKSPALERLLEEVREHYLGAPEVSNAKRQTWEER
jgi:nicotinate phosphoribosyltransferase